MKGQEVFSPNHWKLPQEDIQQKLAVAYADYYQIKAQKDNCNMWLGQLIAAQATAKNMTKMWLWKQLCQ